MHSSAHHPTAAPPPASAADSCWIISGRRGHDPRPGCPATVDLDAAGGGVVLGDAAAADHLLGVELQPDWRRVDHWTRGADVTAIYESNDSRHLRATAMWRLQPCVSGARGWQAIVSTQTSLLQSDSILAVTSTLQSDPGDTWLWGTCGDGTVHWRAKADSAATCVLLRRAGPNAVSILVAGHPGEVDRVEARPRHDGRTAVTCCLFAATLEKGVLLRSRVLAAVGPARGDESWATAAAAEFAALPPMLTT